jgi:putative membrane protein
MTTPAIFAFLHHVAAFTLVSAIGIELALFSQTPTVAQARKLRIIDAHYGMAALAILIIGFARVFHFEKGSAYYFHNGWFITKLALFAIVGLLSIYPTVVFGKWKGAIQRGEAPVVSAEAARRIRLCLILELAGIAGILLAAPLMARGIGLFGL